MTRKKDGQGKWQAGNMFRVRKRVRTVVRKEQCPWQNVQAGGRQESSSPIGRSP